MQVFVETDGTEVNVESLKATVKALIFSVSMDVIHAIIGMGDKMAIYEENGNLDDDTLREWLYNTIAGTDRELEFNFKLLQDNFTTFRARMMAFEDLNEDGTIKIREIRVPTKALTGFVDNDLEQIFQYGQNDFQPRQCCSLSMADVVEYDDDLYIVASCGFKKITDEQFNELALMDRRDRSFSELVREAA